MKYINVRNEIKSGDLLAWSGKAIFSKIIRMLTQSNYSHVGIAWKIGGRLFVIESMDNIGVRIVLLSKRTPFHLISLPECRWNDEIEKVALEHLGDKYSWIGCIKAFFKLKLKKDKYWQCAEFAKHIISLMGYDVDNCVTPTLLVRRMLTYNGILRLIY